MDTISIQKEVSLAGHYDIVVCGGGPAGFIASVAAARSGARVALIERYGFVGGMATAGLVSPMSVFMYNGQLVVGGIPWEFVKRLEAENGAQVELPLGNVSFVPELYKLVAQRMLLESGVTLYLHAYISGCQKQDGRLTHVVFESKSGTQALAADCFIDCTGDGDLASMSGVPMQSYPGPLQPVSLCFTLGGVDTDHVDKIHHSLQGVNYHIEPMRQKLLELAKTGEVPDFGGPWMCWMLTRGQVQVNMTRTAADMTDEREQTRAECVLREDVHKFVRLLREHFEPFRNAYLIATAAQVGVRETRHIKGVHTLSGEEYLEPVHFPDAIARGAHPIDIHSSNGSGQKCEFLKDAAYIPYRSLIIAGFPNLLVASRCFSADRDASASARVQASVMGIGQAAGLAAALCIKDRCSVLDVDTDELRRQLTALGAVI